MMETGFSLQNLGNDAQKIMLYICFLNSGLGVCVEMEATFGMYEMLYAVTYSETVRP